MNLADAIRQAALRQAEEHGNKEHNAMPNQGSKPEPQAQPAASPSPVTTETPRTMPTPEPAMAEAKPEPVKASEPKAEPASATKPTREPELTVSHVNREETGSEPPVAGPEWGHDTGRLTFETGHEEARRLFAADSATGEPVELPEAPMGGSGTGNAVRFEIFLSPEQLSCLFRALVATQHSMMTMREAANYLRITSSALEQLAQEGKIPALQIEGRWRFPKSGIDEWVMLQSFREAEVDDAA